ncbi:MAG TPA: efflux RND transporter periplasmic adaptor subunit [Thermoanaerobaculia bacterium]|jgi:HlyD family secretion protein|nr:efflux RND transporter periplasmic adaptor subunit [Thermoanaerobaculia bacterium]
MIENVSVMDKAIERPRGLSRGIWIALIAAGVLLVLLLLALPTIRRWSRADRSVAASQVRIGEVTRGTLVRDTSADGRVVAALHPTLFTPSAGIVALAVKAGDSVSKGQALAKVESPELKSKLAQERATLASAKSALDRQRIDARQDQIKNAHAVDLLEVRLQAARRLMERAQKAFDEGILNKNDYEKAKDDVQIADLELKNARETTRLAVETADFDIKSRQLAVDRQAALSEELQRQVEALTIAAPFDGIVASVAVQDRDSVPANSPIATVVNLSKFEVEFTLPENYAAEVSPGTSARIFYEGTDYPGRVTAMSPEIRDSQGHGTVVFDGAPPPNLRQSQRVSVRMVFESRPDVLKVPRGPFLESGGGKQIYVVENGVAVKREIAVGAVSVSEVEILRGLSKGDKVVLSDMAELGGAKTVLIRN